MTADFDILMVPTQCSTAWVPYRPGEPIPPGAVVAGTETAKERYVILPMDFSYTKYGSYTIGDAHGYYIDGDVAISCENMVMLVTLPW